MKFLLCHSEKTQKHGCPGVDLGEGKGQWSASPARVCLSGWPRRLLHPVDRHVGFISTQMPGCIKVRDSLTKLLQRIARALNKSLWLWGIRTVYAADFRTTHWFVKQPLCAIIWDAVNGEKGGRWNHFVVLWEVRTMLEEKTNSHHTFIETKVCSKPESWRRSKLSFLGCYYRPRWPAVESKIRHSVKTTVLFSRTT